MGETNQLKIDEIGVTLTRKARLHTAKCVSMDTLRTRTKIHWCTQHAQKQDTLLTHDTLRNMTHFNTHDTLINKTHYFAQPIQKQKTLFCYRRTQLALGLGQKSSLIPYLIQMKRFN